MKRVKITYRAAYAAPDAVEGYTYAQEYKTDNVKKWGCLFEVAKVLRITRRQYNRARHNISIGGDCGVWFDLPDPWDTLVLVDNNGYVDRFLQ